ncbi:MAG: RNA polymerase subunit sigma-24, partial [Sphingobium sp.]|nr:RNA polymerase subunit sigma-24 [Sphingobium sp.]
MSDPLSASFRAARAQLVAALAARFRDLDLAEDALAEAFARAVTAWTPLPPRDPAAWLYRVATRIALDRVRHAAVRA